MLKREVVAGAIVLAATPLIWAVGRIATRAGPEPRPGRLLVVTVTVTLVAVLALVISFVGHAPTSLHELLHV